MKTRSPSSILAAILLVALLPLPYALYLNC